MSCHWWQTYEKILAALRTNERVFEMKRDPDSLVSVRSGSHKKYSHHKAASVKMAGGWGSGILTGDSEAAQQARANLFNRVSKVSGQETKPNHNVPRGKRLADKQRNFAPST